MTKLTKKVDVSSVAHVSPHSLLHNRKTFSLFRIYSSSNFSLLSSQLPSMHFLTNWCYMGQPFSSACTETNDNWSSLLIYVHVHVSPEFFLLGQYNAIDNQHHLYLKVNHSGLLFHLASCITTNGCNDGESNLRVAKNRAAL